MRAAGTVLLTAYSIESLWGSGVSAIYVGVSVYLLDRVHTQVAGAKYVRHCKVFSYYGF